ncbi:MAG: glutamate synthase subunit beta [Elusimicrobia bacterium]|nr:glutamate synthase subunit beta [Elusimicrobiota bacterium]
MGKATGFLEYERKAAGYRPVKERIKDYKDVSLYLSDEEVRKQAARCMNCGIPYCHSTGCPVGNLIPEWNDLVYKGRWEEALQRLLSTNPLPEITGRVCPATCETSCTLSINSAPVTIRQVELAIIEYGFEKGLLKPVVSSRKPGTSVAIIGSGPAGLSAAIILSGYGHDVTVYEKSHEIGGILRYGIPDFKLEKWVLDRRIDIMGKSGIKFETDVNIGEDISAKWLRKSYNALLITAGAGQPRDLNIPGRELEGVYYAMDYLSASNCAVSGESPLDKNMSARNRNVLVIGGGDTGSDCVGTANRQGAKKVYQFEILPRPAEWNQPWNFSWPDWPVMLRTTSSHEEGAERRWAITTREIRGSKGRVEEVHCMEVEWDEPEKGKNPQFREMPGSSFVLEADMVILAMGFVHVQHGTLLEDLGVEYDSRGNIKTEDYSTSVKGVYAAGDSATGASLVVNAIKHGKAAAEKINAFLSR